MIIKSIESICKKTYPVHTFTSKTKDNNIQNPYIHYISDSNWFLDIKKVCNITENIVYLDLDKLKDRYKLPVALAVLQSMYKLTHFLTSKKKRVVRLFILQHYDIVILLRSIAIGNDISSYPANKLDPNTFCEYTQKLLGGEEGIEVSWYDHRKMKKMGMNLIVAVGKGAQAPPRFLKIKLIVDEKMPTVCLVGKGVIFDSGGYNLKPSAYMKNMKGDKTGGAVVISIFHYFAKNKHMLNYNLIGIIPLVENLISHKAQKTGDIYTAYNGKTVEIANTDAEGRLIMAEALAYISKHYNPVLTMDFATLTGWAGLLHCDTSFIYFTTNNRLAKKIEYNSEKTGERNIRLPNWPEYTDYTKSDVADYKNANYNCKQSDGFMASMFLMNFVADPDKWIHFDITHSFKNNSSCICNAAATAIELLKSTRI